MVTLEILKIISKTNVPFIFVYLLNFQKYL